MRLTSWLPGLGGSTGGVAALASGAKLAMVGGRRMEEEREGGQSKVWTDTGACDSWVWGREHTR